MTDTTALPDAQGTDALRQAQGPDGQGPEASAGLSTDERDALATEAITLVRRWLKAASTIPADSSAQQLAGVLKDPTGLEFTVGFVDGVVRPEDLSVAARNLQTIAPKVPAFLPWYMKAAVRCGGAFAPLLPGIVIPISRKVLRNMVGHLVVDATDKKLGPAIGKIKTPGTRLNVNLLGEAVLGTKEAARRLDGTHKLLARDDVDYVSIKVSSTVSPHSVWAFDEAVDHVVTSLTPLFERAVKASPAKFINLDMEEYKDLDLTIAVFTKLLDLPKFKQLEAGIVLQAYLPDALSAMIRLQEWAAGRRAAGGAGVKVRIVKGANLPMEQVESSLHDWPLATWSTKQESDTNYKRVVEYALHPDRIDNVRIGVAGHNLFDIAFAWLLAKQRGVERGIEFEMLLGMAQGQAEAVKRDVGELLLYTPVVHPQEFDVAIAYLIRRLEEGASQDNFMSAVFELSENETLFAREQHRFLASLDELDATIPAPNRQQDRTRAVEASPVDRFENTPDTDPSLPANRVWGREILERVADSTLGLDTIAASTLATVEALDAVIDGATAAGAAWGGLTGAERAVILHRAGDVLEANRARLMEVMASETGKTLDQSDPEVSEAIDFAHFYAERGRDLDTVDGAVFTPAKLTVVTPPWNFPVAIPAGSTLAALAAGSPVIIKPAPQAIRSGAVMVEALWEAGVPRDVLRLVQVDEGDLGRHLISHPSVERVILTGGYETAELFRSFRPELPLLAETSGKNAIIVTPSADLDLAVKDVVNSAFGHAGQKCSAASLVILVGSVATSRRFRNQLVDAVASLKVGYPVDPTTQMGPVIEPAAGKLLSGLTTLGAGESWLITPKQLDESGRLWSPGVRTGVARGSEYHLTEYFGPILGIMTAATLEEAIAIQNEIDYGLTSGLHSLNADELGVWLDGVQAGNLYVNRGITGAIVQRQPFGGWKKSAVGAGTKAGGPNYLIGLGSWTSAESTALDTAGRAAERRGVPSTIAALLRAADAVLTADDFASVRRAIASDSAAWADEFGTAKDVSQLSAERNVFRYVPRTVHVRLSDGAPLAHLVRVMGAAAAAGGTVHVSSSVALPAPLASAIGGIAASVTVESDDRWLVTAASLRGVQSGSRIRLIGGSTEGIAHATDGSPDVAVYANPVTEAGRIELLPFLQEQAVSITAHRFGTPNHLSDALI
ncbi:bifunctional proline dehydrogenase/L-glutamate gamma-semialdehyde dehydrogenase [Plantibacter sp. YIM 135347]|uniref:bifunctional proline dehydrogenase/L-glutamate gamma-semialdehyde dehydrogenase n=1 Tax=Plantibacter sp. YIM 135347 TaxID=3423919 RepID=UPI003D347F56